jgi:hypothetical protein
MLKIDAMKEITGMGWIAYNPKIREAMKCAIGCDGISSYYKNGSLVSPFFLVGGLVNKNLLQDGWEVLKENIPLADFKFPARYKELTVVEAAELLMKPDDCRGVQVSDNEIWVDAKLVGLHHFDGGVLFGVKCEGQLDMTHWYKCRIKVE